MAVANAIVDLGLVDLNYTYLIIGDGWALSRDTNGVLVPNPTKFPNGIQSLADSLNSMGLKLGITTDRGKTTCDGRRNTGSQGFEQLDAETFLSWGVEYVYSSSCLETTPQDHQTAFDQYSLFNKYLKSINSSVFFAVGGGWSWYVPESVNTYLGDSWTVAPSQDTWEEFLVTGDIIAHLYGYIGPDQGWTDIGLLNPKFTPTQRRTQFNLAAILSSPIIHSFNLRNLSQWDFETLTNREVLDVNQDPAGIGSERMTGGPNAKGVPPVYSVHKCNTTMLEQKWSLVPLHPNNPEKFQIFSDYLPGYCLAALSGTDNGCGISNQQVFLVPCNGSASCPDTTVWSLDPQTGLLKNHGDLQNTPGPYATVDQVTCGDYKCHWSGIFLEESFTDRETIGRQQWSYDKKHKLLINKVGVSENGTCLQSTRPGRTNIYGKLLSDGSFIMLMTNHGPTAANVTCDAAKCFGPVHFPLKFPVSIRNLWTHEEVGVLNQGPFSVLVEGNGGSEMFKFIHVG